MHFIVEFVKDVRIQSSVNYSKMAIKDITDDVSVVVQTNVKQVRHETMVCHVSRFHH